MSYASLFERLLNLDVEKARQEAATWPTDDDNVFARLTVLESDDEDTLEAWWTGYLWGVKTLPPMDLFEKLKPHFLAKAASQTKSERDNRDSLADLVLASWACPGHIRLRPPRNIAQRFVDLACGGTAPGLFEDFDGLLCRAGKCFGAAIDYLAVVHMPADAIFDKKLVQPVIEPACIVVEPLRECRMERFSNVIDLVPRTVGNKPDDLFPDVGVSDQLFRLGGTSNT